MSPPNEKTPGPRAEGIPKENTHHGGHHNRRGLGQFNPELCGVCRTVLHRSDSRRDGVCLTCYLRGAA